MPGIAQVWLTESELDAVVTTIEMWTDMDFRWPELEAAWEKLRAAQGGVACPAREEST